MEHKLATAEKKVLAELVTITQKRELVGENGGWKEFLNVFDKKFGSSVSDPKKRSTDVLVAFLSTFKKKEDLQLFARVLQRDANRKLIEKFKQESSDKETPEQRLVRMTITHSQYPTNFAFPSHAEDWFVTEHGKKKSKVMKSTRMIAIDCEMVTCEDGREAVVRVGAVDRDLKVVLDKFVKPSLPVVNYKTEITGVTAEDLEKATLSVADIQKKMRRFLSMGTVLVGHGLHNDLKVLRIDHARVIDTSLVYKYVGGINTGPPSLNNLCKSVLGHEVRMKDAAHNCVHDAAAAMKLVLAVVEKGVDTSLPVSEEMLNDEKTKRETDPAKLLLHKIPHNVSSQELQGVLTGDFTLDVKAPKREGGYCKAVAAFNSSEDANQAFENLDGAVVKDTSGLPQKEVVFKLNCGSGACLYVRKMVQDGEISAKKRTNTEENNVSSKRQKREDDTEETREGNVNGRSEESLCAIDTSIPLSEEMLKDEKTKRETDPAKLFLHKIPHNVSSQTLQGVLTGDFTLDVKAPKREGGYCNAVAVFNSSEDANHSFENLDGAVVKDTNGLPQKKVVFKLSGGSGACLYVRKMVQDGEISAKKRTNTEENNVSSKRQKREDDSEETREGNVNGRSKESLCEDHLKEIEELKQKLKAKDFVKSSEDHLKKIEELKEKLKAKEFEVQTQDKIITNLKKRLEMKKSKARS